MNIWGVGGKWFFWSFVAAAPVVVCSRIVDGRGMVVDISPWWFYGAGILFLLVGIPFWMISAITLKKAFTSQLLCTTGVFDLCRNPIYAAWILFLTPGVLLFFRDPLLLAIPFLMYVVLRALLPREEKWLEEKYGEVYRQYRRRVPRVFPRLYILFPLSKE